MSDHSKTTEHLTVSCGPEPTEGASMTPAQRKAAVEAFIHRHGGPASARRPGGCTRKLARPIEERPKWVAESLAVLVDVRDTLDRPATWREIEAHLRRHRAPVSVSSVVGNAIPWFIRVDMATRTLIAGATAWEPTEFGRLEVARLRAAGVLPAPDTTRQGATR